MADKVPEDIDLVSLLPEWKKKYDSMGVTPRELYMRQNGLCWLKMNLNAEGEFELRCTDGKDEALTEKMLNPTVECMNCIASFACKIAKDVKKD